MRRDGCWQRRVLQGKQIGLRLGALLHAALLLLLDLLPVLKRVHLVIVLHPWTPPFQFPDSDLSPQKLHVLCRSHLTFHSVRCYASEGDACCQRKLSSSDGSMPDGREESAETLTALKLTSKGRAPFGPPVWA